MATIDPNAELFDDDITNVVDADTSFASVDMNNNNGPSAPPPMGAPPPVVEEDGGGGTLIITVREKDIVCDFSNVVLEIAC